MIIIYAPSEALARHTRDSMPSAPFSPRSHQTLLWRCACEHCERLPFHLSRVGAVILADKSSDVISHRQQILRRLNVSQEGGHSAISLCSIYISHPGFSRVKSSSPLLDKMYIMDLSFYRNEGNMQKNIKHDTYDTLMHPCCDCFKYIIFYPQEQIAILCG